MCTYHANNDCIILRNWTSTRSASLVCALGVPESSYESLKYAFKGAGFSPVKLDVNIARSVGLVPLFFLGAALSSAFEPYVPIWSNYRDRQDARLSAQTMVQTVSNNPPVAVTPN